MIHCDYMGLDSKGWLERSDDAKDAVTKDLKPEVTPGEEKEVNIVEASNREDVLPPLHDEPTDDAAARFIRDAEKKLKEGE